MCHSVISTEGSFAMGFLQNGLNRQHPKQGTAKQGTAKRGQEDVNGEKLAVKKWWIFGADFFHGLGADFFTVYADFSRFCKGHKR